MTNKKKQTFDRQSKITIGSEITDSFIKCYNDYTHNVSYPLKDRNLMTELTGDGNQKVLAKHENFARKTEI